MNPLVLAKRCVEGVPEPLGRYGKYIPYAWRLGPAYWRSRRRLRSFQAASGEALRAAIFARVLRIVRYAEACNPFYRTFYARHAFRSDLLRGFDDLERIPVVTKADLREFDLEARSSCRLGRMRVNTGGTSGEPLEFYLDRAAFAREWAHMHFIWARLGYRQTDLKLTFRGKNLGARPLRYNAVHNEYLVNAYAGLAEVAEAVGRLAERTTVRFLHGYPSTIYEFARYCHTSAPDVAARLRRSLRGILLGSEFPAPVYRRTISETLPIPSLSWYGHSEMAVLAYETQEYVYTPLQSYGYCEAMKTGDDAYRLLGTSYDNTASPFIRYDTGDSVLPADDEEVLRSFRVKSGRIGEVILDERAQPISLTALVFGRHHRVFSYARFVQVCQERPGEATILATVPSGTGLSAQEVAGDFDQRDVAVRFRFELLHEPIRTPAGKTPLLVRPDQLVRAGSQVRSVVPSR